MDLTTPSGIIALLLAIMAGVGLAYALGLIDKLKKNEQLYEKALHIHDQVANMRPIPSDVVEDMRELTLMLYDKSNIELPLPTAEGNTCQCQLCDPQGERSVWEDDEC